MTYEHEQADRGIAEAADTFIRQKQQEKVEEPAFFQELKTQLSMGFLSNYVYRRRGSVEDGVNFVQGRFPKWKQEYTQLMRSSVQDEDSELQARVCDSLTWRDLISYASTMFTEFTTITQQHPVGTPKWKRDGETADNWSRALEIVTKAAHPIPEPRVP